MIKNKHWALITGASSGIGRAIAFRLAKAGYALLLIARDKIKLEEVANQCRDINNVKVVTLIEDLNDDSSPQRIMLALQKQKINVDLLINNAGISHLGPFIEQDWCTIKNVWQVNMTSLLHLTHLMAKEMKYRRQGHIVNISSVYAVAPVAYQAVYAASKAALYQFSLALAEELKSSKVALTVVCPGTTTNTRFRRRLNQQDPKHFTKTADQVAHQVIKAINKQHLRCVPGIFNKLFFQLVPWIPIRYRAALVKKMAYQGRGITIEKG